MQKTVFHVSVSKQNQPRQFRLYLLCILSVRGDQTNQANSQKHIRSNPQGEFSRQCFSESPMSGEYFGRLIASGEWGVCLLSNGFNYQHFILRHIHSFKISIFQLNNCCCIFKMNSSAFILNYEAIDKSNLHLKRYISIYTIPVFKQCAL